MSPSLKLMLLLWKLGLVDTYSLIQYCVNGGSQYAAIVAASAAGSFSDIGPKVLFEPIIGFGTSYRFIAAAKTAAERKARIATIAAFLSTSGAAIATTDPATNAAVGGAIASNIAYMRAVLARGGGSGGGGVFYDSASYSLNLKKFVITVDSVKPPVMNVHPYRAEFTHKSKIIINNIFQEHTARRCMQGSAQKFKVVAPTYLALMASASTTANTTALIGWTFLGFGLISGTILVALYLFQRAERKRWQNEDNVNMQDLTGLERPEHLKYII